MREKSVEDQIKHFVRSSGGLCVKLHADAHQGKTTLDLLGGYQGRPFLVEVKRPGGEVSATQEVLVLVARRNGFVSGVVESVDEFKALFHNG